MSLGGHAALLQYCGTLLFMTAAVAITQPTCHLWMHMTSTNRQGSAFLSLEDYFFKSYHEKKRKSVLDLQQPLAGKIHSTWQLAHILWAHLRYVLPFAVSSVVKKLRMVSKKWSCVLIINTLWNVLELLHRKPLFGDWFSSQFLRSLNSEQRCMCRLNHQWWRNVTKRLGMNGFKVAIHLNPLVGIGLCHDVLHWDISAGWSKYECKASKVSGSFLIFIFNEPFRVRLYSRLLLS